MTMASANMPLSWRLDGTPIDPLMEGLLAEEAPDEDWKIIRMRNPRTGPKGRAKIFDMADVPNLLMWAEQNEQVPEAAICKIGFSFYAGLRSSEISRLTMRDVLDSYGRVGRVIDIPPRVGKGGRPRQIPTHPYLHWGITRFRERFPDLDYFAFCKPNGKHQGENATTNWFFNIYKKIGLNGCSSHSGRRSLITFLANNHGKLGMSLVDVQRIAGHANLNSTQAYIEPSADLHRLIEAVPWTPWAEPSAAPEVPTTFVPPAPLPPRPATVDPLRGFAPDVWGNFGASSQ